ncbi:lysoplasmalogenase [Flavobacteriales bacterium]|nr:lysoplasmalogenase [Flavobacteriales bacterium]
MKTGPSQEPSMRADRTLDAALLTIVIALFVAAGFGLKELPGGASEWMPKEWKGVHDCAKGLILPLLALRFGLALYSRSDDRVLRNRVLIAMAFCWIGDVALTFSGETAFLIGLVSFLAGHVMFLMAFRHLLSQGASRSSKRNQAVTMVLLFGVLTPTMSHLWGMAGDLAPAVAVYAAVIATMAYFSWVLGNGPGVMALRIGALFFMFSDLTLAFGRFGDAPIPNGHLWVMGTYILAQWALTMGFTEVALHRAASRP